MKKLMSIATVFVMLLLAANTSAQTPGTMQPGTPNSTPQNPNLNPQNPNLNPQNPNTAPVNPNYTPTNGPNGSTGQLGFTGPTGTRGSTGIYPSGPSGELNDSRHHNLNYNQQKGLTGPTGKH